MNANASTTALFYALAIVISIAAVAYVDSAYNPPQPSVQIHFNYTAQVGKGYINNTLPYAIQITDIYCTTPNGNKNVFGSPNNNTLNPGSNTFIIIDTSNKAIILPTDCADWKVSYTKTNSLSSNTSNNPFTVSIKQS